MIKLAILLVCFCALCLLGVIEKIRNQKNLERLAVRINVNGIRGKSTVTRLITGILHEAGLATVGKTTGTAARIIIPSQDEEYPIRRTPQGPNIKEQLHTIQKAVSLNAEALVCECMAVRPEYQDVYQNQMFHANITVIVNILADHLDVMGPSNDEIAKAFSKSIPWNGILVIPENRYRKYFTKLAAERNTKVFVADERQIPQGYLEEFDYFLFPNNVALALAVADSLGIRHATALEGMLRARPDPGALRINHLDSLYWNNSIFVNGFAANEPQSSLNIWQQIRSNGRLPDENPIVLFNGRPDRVDRTLQFIQDFFPLLEGVTLVGMGQCIQPIKKAMGDGLFPGVVEYIHLEDFAGEQVADVLRPLMKRRLLFGVGNIHGDAHELIEILLSPRDSSQVSVAVAADMPAASSAVYPSEANRTPYKPTTEKVAFMNATARLSKASTKKSLKNTPITDQIPAGVPAMPSTDNADINKSGWAVVKDNVVYTRFNKKKAVSNNQKRQSARS